MFIWDEVTHTHSRGLHPPYVRHISDPLISKYISPHLSHLPNCWRQNSSVHLWLNSKRLADHITCYEPFTDRGICLYLSICTNIFEILSHPANKLKKDKQTNRLKVTDWGRCVRGLVMSSYVCAVWVQPGSGGEQQGQCPWNTPSTCSVNKQRNKHTHSKPSVIWTKAYKLCDTVNFK